MSPTLVNCGRKPRRPKRPLTAYITFMKKFLRAQCIKSKKEAQTAVRAGAKRWNKMSDSEKAKYGKSCAKGRMQYLIEKAEYIRQIKAMRAPPRPYGAFLINYFRETTTSNMKGKSCIERNREARSVWHSLPQSEKDKYRNDFYEQYDDFCRRLEDQQRNSNSGEFVALGQAMPSSSSSTSSSSDPTLFDLRKHRRERHRFLLQQKLQRQQQLQSAIRTSHSQKQDGRSLILEQDENNNNSNSNNTTTNNKIGETDAAKSKENQSQGQEGSNKSASPASAPSPASPAPTSSEIKARDRRALRRRKASETKDDSRISSSRAEKTAKRIKFGGEQKNTGRNSSKAGASGSSSKAVDTKITKNLGANNKQSGGKASSSSGSGALNVRGRRRR